MKRIQISKEAFQDLEDGFHFYELQKSGLGDYFSASLQADIERQKNSAGIHSIAYRDYNHVVSNVFPFGIFYTDESDIVIVWTIVDMRRDPEWIREHLSR